MMELTINVNGLDRLAEAIEQLVQIWGGGIPAIVQQQAQPMQQPPVQQQPVQQPMQPQPIQQTPLPVPQQPPMQVIPTTPVSQAFSMDQLAIAATSIVDAGKQDVLMGILSQFGVQFLTQISPDNYPALAARLREAGARI